MAEAPASARAWDMFQPRPRAPLKEVGERLLGLLLGRRGYCGGL